MSSFTDSMIDDGVSDEEEYLLYLEELALSDCSDYDFSDCNINDDIYGGYTKYQHQVSILQWLLSSEFVIKPDAFDIIINETCIKTYLVPYDIKVRLNTGDAVLLWKWLVECGFNEENIIYGYRFELDQSGIKLIDTLKEIPFGHIDKEFPPKQIDTYDEFTQQRVPGYPPQGVGSPDP